MTQYSMSGGWWLAQAGTSAGEAPAGPALPGETTGTGQPGTVPGPGPGGGGGSATPPGFGSLLWPILLVFLVVIVISSMTNRKETKRRRLMLSDLGKGDKVQTLGGIIGTIAEMHDQEVVLRVDEASNTRIRFSRSAIQQVLRSGREKEKPGERAEPPQIETRSSTPARV
jgi:preprotein translocase subunit YajC